MAKDLAIRNESKKVDRREGEPDQILEETWKFDKEFYDQVDKNLILFGIETNNTQNYLSSVIFKKALK